MHANHPVEVAPSILAADFSALGDAIRAVERAGVKMLHVDVMDGHFVPNISIGVPVVESLRKATELTLDAHLMIEHPEQYIERSEEHTSELQSLAYLVCRLLLEKKKKNRNQE